jgi:hypothetical protein
MMELHQTHNSLSFHERDATVRSQSWSPIPDTLINSNRSGPFWRSDSRKYFILTVENIKQIFMLYWGLESAIQRLINLKPHVMLTLIPICKVAILVKIDEIQQKLSC